VETPRPEPGVEAVRQAVDVAHAATSQAASAPAAPATPSAPAPVARAAPADGSGATATASTGPRAVPFGEIQCSTPEPRYPLAARRLGEQGTVRVRLVIDEAGAAEQAELLSSSGSERLDRVALEAARATRCRPYRADGRPIRVSAVRPFAFRLE
jgi:protein TonB